MSDDYLKPGVDYSGKAHMRPTASPENVKRNREGEDRAKRRKAKLRKREAMLEWMIQRSASVLRESTGKGFCVMVGGSQWAFGDDPYKALEAAIQRDADVAAYRAEPHGPVDRPHDLTPSEGT